MTKAPLFPDELIEACREAYQCSGYVKLTPDYVRLILTAAHSLGYASEVPWREAAARKVEKEAQAARRKGYVDAARTLESMGYAFRTGRPAFDTAPPSPVEPDYYPGDHGAAEYDLEQDAKDYDADKADAVTRAEFNHLFHGVVALANGRTDDAFDELDACAGWPRLGGPFAQLAKMKLGKTLQKTPNKESAPSVGGSEDGAEAEAAECDREAAVSKPTQPEPPSEAALEPGQLAYEAWAHEQMLLGNTPVPWWVARKDSPSNASAYAAAEAAVRAQARAEAFEEAKGEVVHLMNTCLIDSVRDALMQMADRFHLMASRERGDD